MAAPFTNLGLKSPFGKSQLDPLFIIEVGDRPIGYSRVFETKRMALNWLVGLVEQNNIYGYWRLDVPIGPFGTPEEYKSADQFVDRIAVHSERAFTARRAAEAALKSFQRHFGEPLYYWDRTAYGAKILDGIKQALKTPSGQ